MRGVAALMVVIYHYSGGFLPAINPAEATGLIAKSYLWVDFFFILSGFVIAHGYGAQFKGVPRGRDLLAFLRERLARLYPLHLVMLALLLALELLKVGLRITGVPGSVNEPFGATTSWNAFFSNLLLLQTTGTQDQLTWNGPSWSIGAEWFAYLLFPLLMPLMIRTRWLSRLALVAVAMVGLFLISRGDSLDVTFDYGLVRCVLEFGLGVITYRLFKERKGGVIGHDVLCVLLGVALLASMHWEAPDLAFPILSCALILSLAQNQGRVTRALTVRPLVYLGTISYSVYMSHFVVLQYIQTTSHAVQDAGIGRALTADQSVGLLGLLVLAILALSHFLYHWIETPARRYLVQT